MAKKHPIQKQGVIEEELNKLFSAEWLRKTAKETGFVKRERKIGPALMFWVLVLGFGVQIQKREPLQVYDVPTKKKVHISRGSFYERFTPELVRFLQVFYTDWRTLHRDRDV
jgi:hypothetical protein